MSQPNLLFRYLTILLLALLIVSCSQKAPRSGDKEQTQIESPTEAVKEADKTAIENQREYQRGIEALSVRDYDQAKLIFTRFTSKNPGLSGAYINLALIAIQQEDEEEASRLTNLAIDLNPAQAQAYNLRAQLHINNGDINKALEDYIKTIELKPDYANAHYNLALLYDIFLQEINLAIEHYSIYLSLLEKEDEKTQDWVKHLKNTLNNG